MQIGARLLKALSGGRTFRHGIHPPEAKDATKDLPIRQFPFAPSLAVPLSQHFGKAALACVRQGQEVTRGETIAKADGWMSVDMHAPVSGTIRRIGLMPTIAGRMMDGIFIEPFPGSTQEVAAGPECDWRTASRDEILKAIQSAGVVGLGGAGFPTHVKLAVPDSKPIDTLVLNGAECEPWLTTDHRVMLEQQADIFTGIRYVLKVTGASRCVIGVEANKADAADSLREALAAPQYADLPVTVDVMAVKYPQGAEKMLIKSVLGREVPSRALPLDVGVVVINVATTAEIGRLLPWGRGIQERVITVSGPGVRDKGNYRIAIGTTLRFLLDTVGTTGDVSRVFMGGPMMGPTASSLDIPITKGTSGIVVLTEAETGPQQQTKTHPCIRCGYCLDACPLFLNPAELGTLAAAGEFQRMADERNLYDCFECGSCTFVCPSNIPLVQRFRVAKATLRRRGTP